MKKSLFLLLILCVPAQTHQLLESSDERISYVCSICQENISRAEASLALLMAVYGEPPTFICDSCRKKGKGKGDAQLEKAAIGYRPALGIVSSRELDTGERDTFRRLPWVQDRLFAQYQKRNNIAVVTPSGYRVLAQRKGKYPIFFVKDPKSSGYRPCKFPTASFDDETTGKRVTVTLPVEEMTPLLTNKILITANFGSDESTLLYLYDPRANMFHRLRDGELVLEMEKCDKALEDRVLLRKFFDDLLAKQKTKKEAEKIARRKKILDTFFNELLEKSKSKKESDPADELAETAV